MDPREIDPQFFRVISMFASACWKQLGKMPDEDGTVSKDLAGAQSTIEILLMLRNKMQGNLTGTEEKLIGDTIARLQEVLEEEQDRREI